MARLCCLGILLRQGSFSVLKHLLFFPFHPAIKYKLLPATKQHTCMKRITVVLYTGGLSGSILQERLGKWWNHLPPEHAHSQFQYSVILVVPVYDNLKLSLTETLNLTNIQMPSHILLYIRTLDMGDDMSLFNTAPLPIPNPNFQDPVLYKHLLAPLPLKQTILDLLDLAHRLDDFSKPVTTNWSLLGEPLAERFLLPSTSFQESSLQHKVLNPIMCKPGGGPWWHLPNKASTSDMLNTIRLSSTNAFYASNDVFLTVCCQYIGMLFTFIFAIGKMIGSLTWKIFTSLCCLATVGFSLLCCSPCKPHENFEVKQINRKVETSLTSTVKPLSRNTLLAQNMGRVVSLKTLQCPFNYRLNTMLLDIFLFPSYEDFILWFCSTTTVQEVIHKHMTRTGSWSLSFIKPFIRNGEKLSNPFLVVDLPVLNVISELGHTSPMFAYTCATSFAYGITRFQSIPWSILCGVDLLISFVISYSLFGAILGRSVFYPLTLVIIVYFVLNEYCMMFLTTIPKGTHVKDIVTSLSLARLVIFFLYIPLVFIRKMGSYFYLFTPSTWKAR